MRNEEFIPIERFCETQKIEISFIHALCDHGLFELVTIQEAEYILPEHVGELEKLVRLHYEMEINLEGIDAIFNLLEKIQKLQAEVKQLKSRLSLYEGE